MTPKQALAEVRRRFGPTGALSTRREGIKSVGHIDLGLFFSIEGEGPTWEAAFRDIDERKIRRELFDEARDQPCPVCFRTMRTKYDPKLPKEKRYLRYPMWTASHDRYECGRCAAKAKAAVEEKTA